MYLLKGSVARSLFWRDERHREAVRAAPGGAAAAVHIDVHGGRDLIVDHAAHALQSSIASIRRCVGVQKTWQPLQYSEGTLICRWLQSASVCALLARLPLACTPPKHSSVAVAQFGQTTKQAYCGPASNTP